VDTLRRTRAPDDTVSVINTATNSVVATVSVGPGPSGFAITLNGAFAYVVNGDNTVSVTNTLNLIQSHLVSPADSQIFQALFGMVLTVLIAMEFKHTLLV
jgi:YVTN family beta-propeller protein